MPYLIAGLLTVLLFVGLVTIHATRRGLPAGVHRLSSVLVAAAGVFGFAIPYVYDRQIGYLYFMVLKPRPIAVSPYEAIVMQFTVGLLINLVVFLLYIGYTRRASFESASTDR
ncbi:hypothetical protein E6P09_01000 [Haloferax mediterranei ATCC 33500]|nr:hypothetical protein [Haloferax mediterranei]MDX5987423.1 hypothetical protein [Haloferax mediterranei ATCC 33500]QCQ73926.1 hypothetical protein E6P09_01000 [Haloferax mediterranei ATCC 33500]